jgi:hypothetical protein
MTDSTELPEIGEPQETTRDASEVDDSINTAFEPIEKVASERTFEDSEAIEAALVELIDSVEVVQPTFEPAAEASLPEEGDPDPTTPNPRPEAPGLSQGEYTPSFSSHAESALDNIRGQTDAVKGAVSGLNMATSTVGDLDEFLNELQAENPEGEDQEAASKKVTKDDSRKPLQPLKDLPIVGGLELQVDGLVEIDKQDLLDTLQSEDAEANENLEAGAVGTQAMLRSIGGVVPGVGGEASNSGFDVRKMSLSSSDSDEDANISSVVYNRPDAPSSAEGGGITGEEGGTDDGGSQTGSQSTDAINSVRQAQGPRSAETIVPQKEGDMQIYEDEVEFRGDGVTPVESPETRHGATVDRAVATAMTEASRGEVGFDEGFDRTSPQQEDEGSDAEKVRSDFSKGVDADNPVAVSERWSEFLENIASNAISMDVNARVQESLREAYDKLNDDLAFETDKQSSGVVMAGDDGDAVDISNLSPGEVQGFEGAAEFRGTVIDFTGRAGVGEGYFLSTFASLAANDPSRLDGGGASGNIGLQVGPEAGSITVGGIATETSAAGKVAGTGSDNSHAGDKDRILVNLEGTDDGPQLDTGGVEEVIDLHKPNQVTDGFGAGGVGDAERGEGVGYQDPGSVTGLEEPGVTHDVPKAEPGGGDPGRDIPGLLGQDDMEPWTEQPDLAGAAAPGGGDPRVGVGGEAGPALQEFEHQLNLQILGIDNATEAAQAASAAMREEADGYGDTYWANVQGDIADLYGNEDSGGDSGGDGNDGDSGGDGNDGDSGGGGNDGDSGGGGNGGDSGGGGDGGGSGSEGSGSIGVGGGSGQSPPAPEIYDPEADVGTHGEAPPGPRTDPTDEPLDLFESMTQPVGEMRERERPREDLKAKMAGNDVDPLAYYTDDHVDLPKTTPGTVDADENLIDPPKPDTGVGGSEQGLEDSDASDLERAD